MSGKLANTSKGHLQTLEQVQERLNNERRIVGNWEKVAAKNGVSLGTACRVARGYEPRTARLRIALGLPILIPVLACPHCGRVHVTKRCPLLRRVPRQRVVPPAWVTEAADWLEKRMIGREEE